MQCVASAEQAAASAALRKPRPPHIKKSLITSKYLHTQKYPASKNHIFCNSDIYDISSKDLVTASTFNRTKIISLKMIPNKKDAVF